MPKKKKKSTTTIKQNKRLVHEVIINAHVLKEVRESHFGGYIGELEAFWRKQVHFQRNRGKMQYRCKGHNGFGMDLEKHARFRVSLLASTGKFSKLLRR